MVTCVKEEKMKTIELTQGLKTTVDGDDFEIMSTSKWCAMKHGRGGAYAVRWNRKAGKHEYMHRVIMNPGKGFDVDHINGDTLDNRRENLRVCSRAENVRNRAKTKRKTLSKYKGVCWHKGRNIWVSYICYNHKTTHLGAFAREEDAARAYNEKAIELFGDFARLNDI
jgi:hypothetical protein